MPPPLFGQLVHVAPENFVGRPNSEGGNGFVKKDHADGSFDVRYCIDGSVEKNVNRLRITSLNPLVTTARRTNDTDVARPSLLAPSHQPQQRSSPLTQPPTPPTSPRGIQHIIIQSRDWSKYDCHPNPLLVHLRDGRSKPKAWLRIDEGDYNKYEKGEKKGEMKSHLNELENNKLVTIKHELERIIHFFDRGQWPNGFTPHADLAYAYGVSARKVRHCVNSHLRKNGSEKRKVRHDVGKTIFNSPAMRQRTYTPYNYFKKLQRKNNPGVSIRDNELKEAYDKLDEHQLHEMKLGAEAEKSIAANIVSEIKTALQKTNGCISWERLASFIAGGENKVQPVSSITLAKYVTATEGFRYFLTQTLPQCTTEHTKKWRKRWSTNFHIFWEGAKMVANKVQVV